MQNIRRSFLSLTNNDPAIKILLEEDKDSLAAVTKLGKEIGESASYLRKYGETQHADLKDITENLSFVSKHIEKGLLDLATQLSKYRDQLKVIKKMSDEMHDLQVKAKSASEKLKKAEQQQRPTETLKRDLEEADANLLQFEASYESSKRSLLKQGFLDEFQGYQELGLRLQTIGHYGKELAKQIPQGAVGPGDEMPIYTGAVTTRKIKEDFTAAFEHSTKTISRPASRAELAPLPRKDSNSSNGSRKNTLNHSPSVSNGSVSPHLLPLNPGIYQQAPLTLPGAIMPPQRDFVAPIVNYQPPSPAANTSPGRRTSIHQSHEQISNRSFEPSAYVHPPNSPPTVSSCPYCNRYVLLPDMNPHIDSNCTAFVVRLVQ